MTDAKLNTIISADNKKFIEASRQAKAEISRLASAITKEYGLSAKEANTLAGQSFRKTQYEVVKTQKQISTMKLVLKDLAAFFTVGLVFNNLRKVSEEIDNIVASANKLDVGVKQFQGLEYAAKRSDVEIDTLETGLKKLRQTIFQAENGNKKAAQSFKDLGLNASELSKLDLATAYIKVSDAINKLNNSTKQAGSATLIFGKNGQEQLNLIRNNVVGLVKEYEKLGGGLSEEDVKRFNELDEATDKLATTIKINLQKALIALSPAITGFSNGVIDAIKKLGELNDQFSTFVNDYLQSSSPQTSKNYNPSFFQEYVVDPLSKNIGDSLDFLGSGYKNNPNIKSSAKLISGSPNSNLITSGANGGARQGITNGVLNNAQQKVEVTVLPSPLFNVEVAASSAISAAIRKGIVSVTSEEASQTGL